MSSMFTDGPDGVGLGTTPEIVTVPSRDLAFRVHVEAALTRGIATPDDSTEEIRRAYPGVRVHRSEPLGTLTPGGSRWYVYRDGEALGPEPGSDWWADESLARTSTGCSRTVHGRECECRRAVWSTAGGDHRCKRRCFTRHEAPTTFEPGSSRERRVAGLGVGKAAEAEVKIDPIEQRERGTSCSSCGAAERGSPLAVVVRIFTS